MKGNESCKYGWRTYVSVPHEGDVERIVDQRCVRLYVLLREYASSCLDL